MIVLDKSYYQQKKTKLESRLFSERFSKFFQASWPYFEQGIPYLHNWHIDAIAEHLEAVKSGQIKKIIINIPPRFAKTDIISIAFPMWIWSTQPEQRFLCASYKKELAMEANRKSRMLLESDWYQERWNIPLAKDQNKKDRFENIYSGVRGCTGLSGTTGYGANYLIADDIHSAVDIHSTAKREAAIKWYLEAFLSRRNNQDDRIIVIMQRLHFKDITGYLLEQDREINHLCIPMEYDGQRSHTVLKWKDPRTEEGQLLFPERFGKESVNQMKHDMRNGYISQYQQRAAPEEGAYIKRAWFHYFTTKNEDGLLFALDENGVKIDITQVFLSIDLAITKNTTSDYFVIAVCALTKDHKLLILDIIRKKLDFPEQIKEIERIYEKYHPAYAIVDATAYQLAMVQALTANGRIVHPFKSNKDKVSKFVPASISYENGTIYHLKNASFLSYFEEELLQFPFAPHDDMCDVVMQAVHMIASMIRPAIINIWK